MVLLVEMPLAYGGGVTLVVTLKLEVMLKLYLACSPGCSRYGSSITQPVMFLVSPGGLTPAEFHRGLPCHLPDPRMAGGKVLRLSWYVCSATPICLRLLPQLMRRADSRANCTAGRSRAIRTPMMAITTSSSTSVNALRGKARVFMR